MTQGVTVVVPTYNRATSLRRLLGSLADADRPRGEFRVVVVDDGSTDETGVVVAGARLPVTYIQQANAGAAAARNNGWRTATTDVVVFVDDDCVIDRRALVGLQHALASADAVGATIRSLNQAPTAAELLMQVEGLASHKVVDGDVKYLVMACAAFRRATLAEVGGFDERFVVSGEDADLTFRLRERGSAVTVTPDAVVFHDHRSGIRELARTYYRHGTAQRQLTASHAGRRDSLRASARDRASVGAWRAAYRRYRREASPWMSVQCVALRALMMLPWLTGAVRGRRSAVKR
jgi:GT2 family glycosyltransferase